MTPAHRLRGAPIWAQILGLLLGGLAAAQLVTLVLTLALPPAPAQRHSLADIAVSLKGGSTSADRQRPLIRTVEAAPPSLQSRGWVVSQGSTAELVKLLRADPADVRLLFYAPPPLAGAAPAPGGRPVAALDQPRELHLASLFPLPEPPPAGAFQRPPEADARRAPGTAGEGPAGPPSGGLTGPPPGLGGPSLRAGAPTTPFGGYPQGPPSGRRSPLAMEAPMIGGAARPRPPTGRLPGFAPRALPRDPLDAAAFDAARIGAPTAPAPDPPPAAQPSRVEALTLPESPDAPSVVPAPPHPDVGPAPALALRPPPAAAAPVPPAVERALAPPTRPAVFGLSRAGYIEGEFVAALRSPDGRWITVRPQPEGFPNSWQRRVLIWFALAFAVVAPLGYLVARRLAAPLNDFAAAAERLGRDPSAEIPPLTGPAEVGRAADAFNLMQSRLKRYLEDRTGMIGAISHDLRTPLARMRFKLEQASPSLRAALDRDIRQMEEMIDSVLSFMRDEATAAERQRVDLRSLLECVVDEADGPVELDQGAPVEVAAEVLALQRVFENLIGNAVKYGERARVSLVVERGEAVVEIADEGPGLTDAEFAEVFKPFFRGAGAKASGRAGMGLGLAVSRSTVRAHGGDLTLHRGEPGLVAEVRLPLAGAVSLAA